MTRASLAKLLADAPWVLRGTVVTRYLKCKRRECAICQRQGGHGPSYYLSTRGEDGKTRMIYVRKGHLTEVQAAVARYKRLKEGLADLARRDLERWRRRTRRPRP
jgi:hypothetical protein